jgi:hypothetical protein
MKKNDFDRNLIIFLLLKPAKKNPSQLRLTAAGRPFRLPDWPNYWFNQQKTQFSLGKTKKKCYQNKLKLISHYFSNLYGRLLKVSLTELALNLTQFPQKNPFLFPIYPAVTEFFVKFNLKIFFLKKSKKINYQSRSEYIRISANYES